MPPKFVDGAWYLFSTRPASCDAATLYAETLACVADELERVADTVTPIKWTGVEALEPADREAWGIPEGAWYVPPQTTENKAVARDLARNVMAHIAALDVLRPAGTTQNCSDLYAEIIANPNDLSKSQLVFGVAAGGTPVYPSLMPNRTAAETVTTANAASLAEQRLLVKAHTLRATAKLLGHSVKSAMQEDLSSAEMGRAKAADLSGSTRAAWGVNAEGKVLRHGTYAHALRVLEGRLEINQQNAPAADPACGGLPAAELVKKANGPATDARLGFSKAMTPGQQEADCLVQDLGIVIAHPEGGDFQSLKDAVSSQAVVRGAQATGIDASNPAHASAWDAFQSGPFAAKLKARVDAIPEANLRHGLSANANLYALLTNQSSQSLAAPACGSNGLKCANLKTYELESVGGVALKDGIPKPDITIPIAARAAQARAASQCGVGLFGAPLEENLKANIEDSMVAMQGPFGLGQSLGKRLVVLREIAAAHSASLPSGAKLQNLAEAAVAETGAWAGKTQVAVSALPDGTTGNASSLNVIIAGIAPQDLGLTNEVDLYDQFVVVFGPPELADCVTGNRQSCPDSYAAFKNVAPASATHTSLTSDAQERKAYGMDGVVLSLNFAASTISPTGIVPIGNSSGEENVLYVVQKHDPNKSGSKGKVIASTPIRLANETIVAPVSDLRDDLLDKVVGVPGEWALDGCKAGKPSPAESKSYCVEGLERDMFVPLENELTSNSDSFENSWKHYLELAKSAAAEADALGRQMIEEGLRIELRKEAAQDELGELCGTYGAADKIVFEGGKVKQPTEGDALRACLEEDKHPIVYLAAMPENGTNAAFIKKNMLLCTDGNGNDGPGKTNPLCKRTEFNDVASLDLATWATVPAAEEIECRGPALSVNSLKTGFIPLKTSEAVSTRFWMEPKRLAMASGRLRLQVREDFEWQLLRDGTVEMSSLPDSEVFPGCLRADATKDCSPARAQGIVDYTLAFRKVDKYVYRPGFIDYNNEYCDGKKFASSGGAYFCIHPTESDENRVILWRVEGAVWTMASMGGYVPSTMFEAPMLVVDFADSSWTAQGPGGGSLSAWDATVFGDGVLEQSGQGTFQLKNYSVAERNLLGQAKLVETNAFWPVYYEEIPGWLRDSYQKLKDNSPHAFKSVMTKLDGQSCQDLETQVGTPAEIGKLVNAMGGLICASQFMAGPESAFYDFGAWSKLSYLKNSGGFYEPGIGACYKYNQWPTDPYGYQGVFDGPTLNNCGPIDHNLPSERPKGTRLKGFINSYRAPDPCAGLAQLAGATVLACRFSGLGDITTPMPMPQLQTTADIRLVEEWVFGEAQRARLILSRLYLEQIPKRVVADIKLGTAGSGSKDGAHGVMVAELEPALREVVSAWSSIENELAALGGSIRSARQQIDIIVLQGKIEQTKLAISQVQLSAAVAERTAQVMSGFSSMITNNPTQFLNGGISAGNGIAQLDYLAQQKALTADLQKFSEQQNNAELVKALIDLGNATTQHHAGLVQALNQLWSSTSRALAKAHEIRNLERKAQMAAAKAKGEPYVMIDDEPVAIPVNAVYDREYKLSRRRYEAALQNARQLAYYARLAIEQRIGRRLNAIMSPVGPMAAPASWADEVCRLGGLNYEDLSTVTLPLDGDAGTPVETGGSGGFPGVSVNTDVLADMLAEASPYVGDYVSKLESFVEHYNVQNPFHEGDDTVVLSVRDDIVAQTKTCSVPAPNLLYFSGALDRWDGVATGPFIGWARSACDPAATTCLQVLPQEALASLTDPPATYAPVPPGGAGEGRATWLRMAPVAEATPWNGPVSSYPGVSQTVQVLTPGPYVLSWYDQARNSDGSLPAETDPVTVYQVSLVGPDGNAVASASPVPYRPVESGAAGAGAWSARHEITVLVSTAGDYTLSFSVGTNETAPPSVVIANVQLEAVASEQGGAGLFYLTEASRDTSVRCPSAKPSELRAAFERRCGPNNECYYELINPITIEPQLLETQSTYFNGKFARGNYNLRHLTVALNLAGTGLLDCSVAQSSSCYATGTVRYTLEHDAFKADIVSGVWDGKLESQSFNFGGAGLFRAQALAAERFITMPVSTADQGLLSQAGIEKGEFMGRPMSGTYRLRIWETPELVWSRLEDVQMVLKYRYWSPVKAAP
ncbi:MAG: hypothetical protein HY898_21305 [Deltaproteobacteria bacterium]|nr:hypothetical protein [Deltaproteobacteria bacterium]